MLPLQTGARTCPKDRRHGHTADLIFHWAGAFAEQMDLGEGCNHVGLGERAFMVITTPPQILILSAADHGGANAA